MINVKTFPILVFAYGTVVLFAVLLGGLAADRPQLAVVLLALVLGSAALSAPTVAWVAAALVAALTLKGLVTLGILPAVATFMDIPIAWGALAVSLLRRRELTPSARFPVALLAGLVVATALSALLNDSELARPVLYLVLLGQPLAVVSAMLVDPPTRRNRYVLERLFIGLLALQIPITYWQAATLGLGDPVQGTLYGAGAGAHVVAGVAVLGIMWLLGRQPLPRRYNLLLIALLAPIPFLADAKQVLFALPFTLLVTRWANPKDVFVRAFAIVASVGILLVYFPAGQTALNFLSRSEGGRGGKTPALAILWTEDRHDLGSIAIGLGPAETVSRAAFLTTDKFRKDGSPLEAIGLHPARFSTNAEVASQIASGGGTSFNSGLSSMVGVFGDIGLVGLCIYTAFWLVLSVRLWITRTAEASAALSGIVVFGILGFVFDWWEQPPFSLVLAIMVGLALSRSNPSRAH